jgi:hypothetical protein
MRRDLLLALTGCALLGATVATTRADDKSLKGPAVKVDDLKVSELKIPGKATLPCMLWADPKGTALLTLEGSTGVLRRISFPAFKVTKEKDFKRKFTWMSLSGYGLLLSDADSEEIWVVDPATLETKSKIGVPKLKRAVSAPNEHLAVACDRGDPLQDQKFYVVDLKEKKAAEWAVPKELKSPNDLTKRPGMDNPAMTPDGAYVFAQGDLVNVNMCRYSFKDGKLKFEETEPNIGDVRFHVGENTPDNSAGITISPDSKYVCQVFPVAIKDGLNTPIYHVESFAKHQCILERGLEKGYPGYRPRERPLSMGFDIKGGYIYSQNGGQEFAVYTIAGAKKKEYMVGFGAVRQFLAHPGGNEVVLLREAAVGADMGRIIHSNTLLIEVPKQK